MIVGVFIWFAIRDNVDELREYQIQSIPLLILAALIFSSNVASTSFAWTLMMKFSGEKIPVFESINLFVSTFIVRYIPGSVWAVIARALANKEHGVKVVKTAWGWMIENISYLMVGLIFSALVLSSIADLPSWIIPLVVVALPLCGIFVLRYELLGKVFDKLVVKRFKKYIGDEYEVLELTMKQKFIILGVYTISWIFYSIHYFVVCKAVSGANLGDFFVLSGINALAWSLGYLSIITPSGGGVREAVMITALTTLGIMGKVDAVVVTLLARLAFIGGELIYFALIKIIALLRKSDGKVLRKGSN